MAMIGNALETEYKFQIDPTLLPDIARWIHSSQTVLHDTQKPQIDSYFDSVPTYRLLRRGASLRLRNIRGDQSEVTCKLAGDVSENGLFQRREVSAVIGSDQIGDGGIGNLSLEPVTLARQIVFTVPLERVLSVHNNRRKIGIHGVDGEMEIALDTVTCARGDEVHPLWQLEIESLGVDVEEMHELVMRLREDFSLVPTTLSKYQLGMQSFGVSLDVPNLALSPGIALAEEWGGEVVQKYGSLIYNVSGGSGSGKTDKGAIAIAKHTGGTMISADHYFRPTNVIERALGGNFDDPRAVRINRIERDVYPNLRDGRSFFMPIHSFTEGRSIGKEEVHPGIVNVVEGIAVLQPELAKFGDINIFIYNDMHGRLWRRMFRDGGRNGRTGQSFREVLRQFLSTVERMHKQYIEPSRRFADIVIDNSYNPLIESENAKGRGYERKFPGWVDEDLLVWLGGIEKGVFHQTDRLYTPQDRDLQSTDETIKVRDHNVPRLNKFLFTYKGPLLSKGFRPRLDVPIMQEDISLIETEYQQQGQVDKIRQLFLLPNGVVVTLDDVTGLGKYTEIVTPPSLQGEEDQIASMLELNPSNMITESYKDLLMNRSK